MHGIVNVRFDENSPVVLWLNKTESISGAMTDATNYVAKILLRDAVITSSLRARAFRERIEVRSQLWKCICEFFEPMILFGEIHVHRRNSDNLEHIFDVFN